MLLETQLKDPECKIPCLAVALKGYERKKVSLKASALIQPNLSRRTANEARSTNRDSVMESRIWKWKVRVTLEHERGSDRNWTVMDTPGNHGRGGQIHR